MQALLSLLEIVFLEEKTGFMRICEDRGFSGDYGGNFRTI
jgi:hypothetical protein